MKTNSNVLQFIKKKNRVWEKSHKDYNSQGLNRDECELNTKKIYLSPLIRIERL